MVAFAVALILACFIYDPTMQLLLYSGLPTEHQNWLSFAVCFVEEMRFIFTFQGIAIPVFQVQVISFDLINQTLQLLLDSLEDDM